MERHGQQRRQNTQRRAGQQSVPGSGPADDGVDDVAQQPQQLYGIPVGAQYPMTYGADPQASPVNPQQQTATQFAQYGSNVMYNMSPPQVSQYGMPSQAQFYNPTQPGAQMLGLAPQGVSVPFPPPDLTAATSQPYAFDPTQAAAHGLYTPQQQLHYQQPVQLQQERQPQQPMPSSQQALDAVQAQLRHVFTLTRDNAIRDAGARLLETSQYFLGNVEAFDDPSQNEARVRLWDGFNQAWLVMLQRQLDLTQQPNRPSTIMDVETLSAMSSELVRLCDGIETHGLVDYQMGVAEDEIVDMILRCIAASRSSGETTPQSASQSSTAGSSRRRGR